MMGKKFCLEADEIRDLATGLGGCIASDLITVQGFPVGFMYRTKPHNNLDSGWKFLSGLEDDAYMADSSNHDIYDVNTIANCDPSIIPFLAEQPGSVFERGPDDNEFRPVTDWQPPE